MGLDLEVYKGEKRIFQFTIYDKNGDPVALTGQIVKFRVWDDLPSAEANQEFEVTATDLDGGGTGNCKVTVTNTEIDITPGLYYYELYVIYTVDTEEYVAERGKFVILTRLEGTSMISLVNPDMIKEWLRIEGDYSWASAELQETIEMAHRELINNMGAYQIERTFGHYEADTNLVYYLPHGSVFQVLRVIQNGETVDTEDYTVEPRAGTITFDSDIVDSNDNLEFWYIPTVYRDLELLYTLRLMGMRGFLQGFGDMNYLNVDKLDEQITKLENNINGKQVMGSVLDYSYHGRYPMYRP